MHETLIDDIKFNLDHFEHHKNSYLLSGWIISQEYEVERLQIMANNHCFVLETSKFKSRDDVNNFYQLTDEKLSGFKFIINTEETFKQIKFSLKYKHEDDYQLIAIIDNKFQSDTEEKSTKKPLINVNNTFPGLVVIDDFYDDPDAARAYALEQEYKGNLNHHKGSRSLNRTHFDGTKQAFEYILNKKITNWENHIYNGVFQFCVAQDSLVYHSDCQTYAAMIFLSPDAPPETGTSFYRSKNNGLMREPTAIDCQERGKSFEELSVEMYDGNFYDKTRWELVDTVGNIYNRLVIFDAKRVHAASGYFGDNIKNSRLFHIFFFDTE